MKLKKAIKILRYHNRWRRGVVDDPKYTPTEIGMAIDKVVEYYGQSYIQGQIQ